MLERMTPRPEQAAASELLLADRRHICRAQVGAGKAQPLDSLVLTKHGFIKMGDVQVGTRVATPDGGEATVAGVYPQGLRPVWELSFKDGRKVRADEDHLWTAATSNLLTDGVTRLVTTKQIVEGLETGDLHHRWFVAHVAPTTVEGEWSSSIPAYALGLLLGNGGLTTGTIYYATSDTETIDYLNSVLPEGHSAEYRCAYDYTITTGKASGAPGRNLWLNELRRLGLMGHKSETKFIPQELLETSFEYRLALLQGLLDTDGSACMPTPRKDKPQMPATAVEYSSASYRLATDVCWLVRSLGGVASWGIKTVKGKDYYRTRIALPKGLKPFRVARKAERMGERTKYKVTHTPFVAAKFVGYEETQCILVDSPEHEYVTDGFVRTHNTLVAVEAAIQAGSQRNAIIAPLNTVTGWKRTFARQGSELPFHHIKTLKDTDKDLGALMSGEPGHYFLGWQLFARYPMWGNFPIDFAVFDEVHRAQSRKSANHKAMSSVQAEYQVGLSATPWGNRIDGAWAPLNCLWPERYPHYWPFVGEFLTKHRNEHAERKTGQKSFTAGDERVPGSVWASIPSKSDFPSPYTEQPTLHSIEVGLTPAQRKLYERFEKESAVWLQEHLLAADLPAVQYLRLMEILLAVPSIREDWIRVRDKDTGEWHKEWGEVVYYEDNAKSSKIEAALEVLSDEVPDHEPALMLTHSRKFATLLTKRLQANGYDARQFVGGMDPDERAWKLEAFGKEYRIMVATIPTVGEGTDMLQDVSNYEFWFSVSDNRILNEQARGRLSRPGQKRRVQRYTFFAEDTIETSRQLPRLERDQLVLDASFPARLAA